MGPFELLAHLAAAVPAERIGAFDFWVHQEINI
jgi:hypothetical protein